jgi:hypothetical protein
LVALVAIRGGGVANNGPSLDTVEIRSDPKKYVECFQEKERNNASRCLNGVDNFTKFMDTATLPDCAKLSGF